MPKVECPECGQKIDKRGFSSHMHHQHGYSYDGMPEPTEFESMSEQVEELSNNAVTYDELNQIVRQSNRDMIRHIFYEECDHDAHVELRESFEEQTGHELPIDQEHGLGQNVLEDPDFMEEFDRMVMDEVIREVL